jgi:hypothetical protein
MRNRLYLPIVLIPIVVVVTVHSTFSQTGANGNGYITVVSGYDWGPAVNKVILPLSASVTTANGANYSVAVERTADGVEMQAGESIGDREVIYAYVSDEDGNLTESGNHVTLTLFVGPDHVLGSPIKYVRRDNRGSNVWINYKMTIKDSANMWNSESGRIHPGLDKFDLEGSFKYNDITMSYASYAPEAKNGKSPLIIWLHGGGEGGSDPSIPVIANKAVNYVSEDIQELFGGAFVLVPQSPTFWMQSASGEYTRGNVDDIYNEALMELIKAYVARNLNIDQNRIYVGGCSNGGYMSPFGREKRPEWVSW